MSDEWTDVAPARVTENNVKTFAGIGPSGYAGGADNEDPATNLKLIEQDLANPKLHPVARKALEEAHASLAGKKTNDAWVDVKPDDSWSDVKPTQSTFKSGDAFKDTKDLIPDVPALWDTFKKQWANRANTPMTPEIATKMMGDEHAAGSAVLDTVGALPAMAAGGIAGVGSAVTNWDASKGLQTGSEVMSALLPSTLLGNKDDQEKGGYKAAMAPLTAVMDTMNAVPQGYGEIVNAFGYKNAAGQITDAGKLAIMATLGTKGAIHMYKSITGKTAASAADASTRLEALLAQDAPKPIEGTKAHADDFAAINPYDVAGHVTESEQGRPSTIDNPQGDLFGGQQLEQPAKSMGGETISAGEVLPSLRNSDGKSNYTGEPIPFDKNAGSMPESTPEAPINHGANTLPFDLNPNIGTRDAARAKAAEKAAADKAWQDEQTTHHEKVKEEQEAAYAEMERLKNSDYGRMEGQKELNFNEQVRNIEERTVARRAFLDRANLDFQFAKDNLGDKSTMGHEPTMDMVEALKRSDVHGVLDTIANSHPSGMYRKLAGFLKDFVQDLNIKLHDEGILKHGERDATGYYDPATHTVGLSGLGAVSPHTVLHEIVHAVTSQFLNQRPGDARSMAIKTLYEGLSKDITKKFPGIVNVKEFLAEAMSNHEFQDFLKSHRANNLTMWQRLVNNIKSILGLRPHIETELGNALDHALDLSKQIMDAQAKNGMDQFKAAGMPGKLADLMATTQHHVPPQPSIKQDIQHLKVPGLESAVSDFAFFDKPVGDIIEMAKTSIDIPNTKTEKVAQQLQGGALFESLKTRNPVVKWTYEKITRATQEAARLVKQNLTSETGLKEYMRALTPDAKGEIHAAMMLDEGQRERSAAELRQAGFSEAQVAYYGKYRELSDQFFKDINERRKAMGMDPMDQRVAHMAGRFMGDFSRFVFDREGKIVGRIAGTTKRELNKASEHIASTNPEWTFGKHEYNTLGQGKAPGDRFSGLMEALNFITKTDSDAKALFDSYRGYMQKDAVNYLNATRHAKAKVQQAGGVIGSEGNKPWLDNVKNAEEGMKAQLAYFEQGYQWMAMEKAVGEIKPLLGNEEVVKQNPNAVEYSQKYLDHALGRNQGPVSDAANWTASKIGEFTGVGHSNLFKGTNIVKHLVMQKFMGLLNIPFTITQLMQPLQVHPAMVALLKTRGMEFSAMDAQLKATQTYLKGMSESGAGRLDPFEKAAMDYADQMGIVDVKMADHTRDINSSPAMEAYNAVADVNITVPERLTRGTSFLFYSHLLKDAGVPLKDVFGAAENMTNMTMVNYHPIERPMGYAKLGWLGDVASTLTRYKHNQLSQLAFYSREAGRADASIASTAPLGAFLATSIAFGGAMGFFAFQEADAIYQMFSEHVLKKPDTLTNVVLSSGMPEVISHGVFSSLGMDMTSRFSNANTLPNSIPEALMPFGSAVLDMAQSAGRLAMDPTSKTKQKQAVKSFAPQSIQGFLENTMFTEKEGDKNLYVNGNPGPNLGVGRVFRTDKQMVQRTLGFRSVSESKELAKNYSDNQIEKSNKNIVENLITKAKYAAMDGTLDDAKFKELAEKASKYGEDPNSFVSKMVTWNEYRHLDQKTQNLLQNAQGGFKGATNIKAGR